MPINKIADWFSKTLDKSFENYRNTPEYKMELEQRMKTLEVFWIFPDFAEALAKDSVETWIKVSELLWVKDLIIKESDKLLGDFSDLNSKKINNMLNAANDDLYKEAA